MKSVSLLKQLGSLIEKYIDDSSVKNQLLGCLDEQHVKYILKEIEENRSCEISEDDSEVIKDLFFYFC